MKNPQIIQKTNPFINEYNWKRINLPSEETIIKKFAKNNVTIALEFFYAKKEKLYPVSISKCNSHRERQVIILMVSNGEKIEGKSDGQWYYVAVKRLSGFLREITSIKMMVFIVWIVFILLEQKKPLMS